ncbi:hypothetical protein J6R97_00570 [bacterium]|nr:hypothetical protein [bacterium]
MSSGLASIALFTPVIASSAIFSARRASRGVDNMEENPLFAIANFDIAAGQVLKAGRAVKGMKLAVDSNFEGVSKYFNTAKSNSKLMNGLYKAIDFTSNNINPLIVGAGCLKVLGSDDKLDTAARESTSLACMFGAEKLAKKFIGMPKFNNSVINPESQGQEGLYKKLFSKEQLKAVKDFSATKKYAKAAIGGAKGLLFVGASIAGYNMGSYIADAVLGKEKEA